jgi:hypothetical protein
MVKQSKQIRRPSILSYRIGGLFLWTNNGPLSNKEIDYPRSPSVRINFFTASLYERGVGWI